jgi:vancomycin resistance protein YoaR
MGIRTLLGTFTQEFDEAEYRTINVGRSAELLNGTLLAPGEVFSMNSTIKQRTPENGYVEGIVIGPGGLLAMSYGGGVSITTAATWGAAFFAGLEPIEQQAHTIWIDRYTPGLEATVSWGSLDLRFRNTTASSILISAKANETSVTVSIWGTPVYDEITAIFGEREVFSDFSVIEQSGEGCVPQEGQPGFRITVTRDFWLDDAVVKSEDFVTTYQPSTEVTCV